MIQSNIQRLIYLLFKRYYGIPIKTPKVWSVIEFSYSRNNVTYYRGKTILVESVPDLNSLLAISLKFTPGDPIQRHCLARAWDAEKRNREEEGEAIGYGYLAKTKLDFYGGQVLIKFGKLEENLDERCRHPRAILHLLLPSTARISPLSPIGFNPYTRSFSHFPLWNRVLAKLDK